MLQESGQRERREPGTEARNGNVCHAGKDEEWAKDGEKQQAGRQAGTGENDVIAAKMGKGGWRQRENGPSPNSPARRGRKLVRGTIKSSKDFFSNNNAQCY